MQRPGSRWLMLCAAVALCGPTWGPGEDPQPRAEPAVVPAEAVEAQPAATPAVEATETAVASTAKPQATHKQFRAIKPQHNGQPIHLNTYCLSPAGDILACVGGSNVTYTRDAEGNYTAQSLTSSGFVQVYGPEGELKAEWEMPFKPTAINVAPDETIYVAGEGKIARLSAKGEVLTTAAIPNIGDPEKFAAEAAEQAKSQRADAIARVQKQIDFAKEQSQKLMEIAEDERTASQKARLKAYERQLASYQDQLTQLEAGVGAATPVVSRDVNPTVTALAVSNSHVFVCATSVKSGGGYDVFRCDFDFQNPKQVLTGLRGCCGQMDIQATGDRLVTAENTKFVVGIYDEEGTPIDSFGSRDRTGGAGFGSCCNPMNVRCCSNGDVLTAESSIGDIKRFSADGKFLGYVGRAKISGGCKHVSVAWDAQRDRYYFMNVSDSSICVLVPLAEAPEFTEDELLAKAAREGLGQKLIGAWRLPGTKAAAPQRRGAFATAINSLLGADRNENDAQAGNTQVAFERAEFGADGSLAISGGMYGQYSVSNWSWAPVRQDETRQTVDFDLQTDGIQYQSFRVELLDADRAKISILMNGSSTAMTAQYVRESAEAAAPTETETAPVEATPAEAAATGGGAN